MDYFKYSWVHDEKFGWTLMEEDFDTPIIDVPIVFHDTMRIVDPKMQERLENLDRGDWVLYKNRPMRIKEKSTVEDKKPSYK